MHDQRTALFQHMDPKSRLSQNPILNSSLIPYNFGPRLRFFGPESGREIRAWISGTEQFWWIPESENSCYHQVSFEFWIPVNWNKRIWLPVIRPINHRDNWTKITTLDLKVWPLWRHTQSFWLLPVTVLKDWTSG